MKKTIIWIVVALVSVGLMAGVYALYNNLSEKYEPDMPALPIVPSKPETDDQKNDSVESDLSTNTDTPDMPAPETELETDGVTEPETEAEVSKYLAPDFTVYDENGKAVKLSDFFGKPIVLNFWATWCYYCKIEMPDFNEVAKKYPDVQFLMVNATGTKGETVETAKKYVADNGFEFDVFYDKDRDALATYGITSFPTTFFIASNGDLYTYVSGALDGDRLEEIIKTVKEYN